MRRNGSGFLLITLVVFAFNQFAEAQTNKYLVKLPVGYIIKDANGSTGPKVEADFDGDGVKDLATLLYGKQTGLPIFCIYLSTVFDKSRTFKYCDWIYMLHDMQYQDRKLILFSDNGSMGQFGSVEMKYDKAKRDLVVVKYEDDAGGKSLRFKEGRLP